MKNTENGDVWPLLYLVSMRFLAGFDGGLGQGILKHSKTTKSKDQSQSSIAVKREVVTLMVHELHS